MSLSHSDTLCFDPFTFSENNADSLNRTVKKRGRKYCLATLILQLFLVASTGRFPKIENLRYRLLRCMKRTIRHYLKHRMFGASGLIQYGGSLRQGIIERIKIAIVEGGELFREFSDLRTGPKADHRRSNKEGTFKTYSLKYMASIFEQNQIFEMYSLFLELIFTESSPQELCKKWKFQCCNGIHNDNCVEKWKKLEEVLKEKVGGDQQDRVLED